MPTIGKVVGTETIYTITEAAKLCAVNPNTFKKWFDANDLGYRLPMSKDRRVVKSKLVAFLREHGMCLGEWAKD